jgi:hypothetical protein
VILAGCFQISEVIELLPPPCAYAILIVQPGLNKKADPQ